MRSSPDTPLQLEYWKPIPGWEGFYEISNVGRVRSMERVIQMKTPSLWRARMLTHVYNRDGYPMVALCKNSVKRSCAVHRLLGEAFIGPLPRGMNTCHNDGRPHNCRVSNIRYDTPSGNTADMKRHGTFHRHRGEESTSAKLTAAQVLAIRRDQSPQRLVAARYGISQALVWSIRNHRVWRHLETTNAAS